MRHWRIWLLCIFLLAAGGVVYSISTRQETPSTYEGTELTGTASDFQLTDQHGSVIHLSDFRGKVVLLTFMDSECKDTCPLTAAQFRRAYSQLDPSEADRVVFLGVNVNVNANSTDDVLQATKTWRLDEIPNWHFLTGSAEELTPIWSEYGVAAIPQSSGEIIHTPGVFLIDEAGQKRWYISTPYSEDGSTEATLPLSELLGDHIREILRKQ